MRTGKSYRRLMLKSASCPTSRFNGRWWVGCQLKSRGDRDASSRDKLLEPMPDQGGMGHCSMHHQRDVPCNPVADVRCNPIRLVASRRDLGCIQSGSLCHRRRHKCRQLAQESLHTHYRLVLRNRRRRTRHSRRKRSGLPGTSCSYRLHSYRLHRTYSPLCPLCVNCDVGSRWIRPKEPQGLQP